jgi:hypothetical protein
MARLAPPLGDAEHQRRSRRSRRSRRFVLYEAAGLMVGGALLNIASPSFVERILWAPVSIALAILLWNAARDASLTREKTFATAE